MVFSDSRIKTFAQANAQTNREKLREHFKRRASSPPYDALPWSSAWIEYVEEMRELERQLTEAGERL